MTNDTLAIIHAIRGDLDSGASVSENARAIISAILGDNIIGGPISSETMILAKAFRGDYAGADGRLSTNGRAILRAIQGDYVPRSTVSSDTLAIIHAIQENAGGGGSPPVKQDQTITFGSLGDKESDDAPFSVSATASSGSAVAFSIVSGPATILGSTVTLTGEAGAVVIRASQAGNGSYNAATPVDQSFDVTAAGPLDVTNVQKLSLPTNTAVGTQVAVSDGFYVSGFGDARDGFYFASPADATIFIQRLPFVGDGTDTRAFLDGPRWSIGNSNLAYVTAEDSGGDNPWDVAWTGSGITLTHPALQQLAAPGGGALLVSGDTSGTYLHNNANPFLWARSDATNPGSSGGGAFILRSESHGDFNDWRFYDTDGATVIYYSLSDTPTPLTATDWKNYSDDSPAAITIALTDPQGGVFVAGGTQDGVYSFQGYTDDLNQTGEHVKSFRLLGVSFGDPLSFNGAAFHVTNLQQQGILGAPTDAGCVIFEQEGSAIYYSLSDVADPSLATDWKNASDDSPASITVTSITVGQIASGLKVGSTFYSVTSPTNGRNGYHDVLGVAADYTFDGTKWTDGVTDGSGNTAFPWEGGIGTRDDVCSESNWESSP